MYAVHIRNHSPTSALRETVPIHAWSGRKPDISHLRIFGSTAYANIPKKVRGGKLEPTSIKCRLLGWWADETKGYRLEEAETRKLITARDVRFVKDTKSDDLAVIEGDEPRWPLDDPFEPPEEEVSGRPEIAKAAEKDELASDESSLLSSPPSSPTSTESSDFTPEGRFEPEPKTSATTPMTPASVPEPEQAPPRTSKWANLPPHEPSTCIR